MRRIIAYGLLISLSFSACVKKSETIRYKKDSKEFIFFKTLSDNAPLLDPDQPKTLITTKKFSIQNLDVMPRLYSISRKQPSFFQNTPKDMLQLYIHQFAAQEAEKKLLLVSAREKGIKASKDTVENQLAMYYKQQGGEEAYIKYITDIGFTLDFIRKDIQNRMMVDRLIEKYIFKNITVSDMEIKAAYAQEKYATVRQIVMRVGGKTPKEIEAVENKMEALRLRAKKGENFGMLADQYSEDTTTKGKGGLYENIPRHVMLASFENTVFNLPLGGISDILKTPEGLFLIRVEKRAKETKPFDQVKDNLRLELIQTKQRNRFTAYMDSLKTRYQYKDLTTQAL